MKAFAAVNYFSTEEKPLPILKAQILKFYRLQVPIPLRHRQKVLLRMI